MITRVLVGAGLLAIGYYVGREIGRTEHIRKELEESRLNASPPEQADVAPTTSRETKKPK